MQQSQASITHTPLTKLLDTSNMETSAADRQSTEGTTAHPAFIKKQLQHPVNLQKSTGYSPRWDTYPFSSISKAMYFWCSLRGLLASILQFLDQNMGRSSFNKNFINPCTGFRLWHHWHPPWQKPEMPPKWCQHWVEAILQHFGNMAWDILTHWNVDDDANWVWPAHTIALVLE